MTPTQGSVAVVGRGDFATGIGSISSGALELFSRFAPTFFYSTDGYGGRDSLLLASGRRIPVLRDRAKLEDCGFVLFTDVLWNGAGQDRSAHMPKNGIRVAHIAFDSSEMPLEWVEALNERFDFVLFSSAYLEDVARRSGVRIPLGTLPIPLDIEPLIGRSYVPSVGRLRIGTISAYHERKGLELLVEAFLAEFGTGEAELVIHSNLIHNSVYERVRNLAKKASHGLIKLSSDNLSDVDKNNLIDSFDVYVNLSAGEGYSIGPREALGLGKPLLLGGVPAHVDLAEAPGVRLVQPSGYRPARYPELDGRVFGLQAAFDVKDIRLGLRSIAQFARSDEAKATAPIRKRLAAQFTRTILERDYRSMVDPDAPTSGRWEGSRFTRLPEELRAAARSRAGRSGVGGGRRRIIVRAHDGGFFSLFNTYMSHLVWADQESSPPMVLPDWDVTRLLKRSRGRLTSYCYSRPEDGNAWVKLFEPMYGLRDEDYNDVDLLSDGSDSPDAFFNEDKEPLLTFVNAYALYHAPWFSRFRRQYSDVVRRHVRLRPEYQAILDEYEHAREGRFLLSVHVKHPSHAMEQPQGRIAGYERYMTEVRSVLDGRGISESSDDWRVFVATDQERVVNEFREEFGDHVAAFNDVTRVDEETHREYDVLDAEEKVREGHQIQHLKAADQASWNVRLAWEVWRDAHVLASSDVLLHAVSNVATAVSYLGPQVQMRFTDPDA